LSDQDQVVIIGQALDDLGIRCATSIERKMLDVDVVFSEATVEA